MLFVCQCYNFVNQFSVVLNAHLGDDVFLKNKDTHKYRTHDRAMTNPVKVKKMLAITLQGGQYAGKQGQTMICVRSQNGTECSSPLQALSKWYNGVRSLRQHKP